MIVFLIIDSRWEYFFSPLRRNFIIWEDSRVLSKIGSISIINVALAYAISKSCLVSLVSPVYQEEISGGFDASIETLTLFGIKIVSEQCIIWIGCWPCEGILRQKFEQIRCKALKATLEVMSRPMVFHPNKFENYSIYYYYMDFFSTEGSKGINKVASSNPKTDSIEIFDNYQEWVF